MTPPNALDIFTAYFVKNYPGPYTIIRNPNWHAPRIFRAAEHAIREAGTLEVEQLRKTLAAVRDDAMRADNDLCAMEARAEMADSQVEQLRKELADEQHIVEMLISYYATLAAENERLTRERDSLNHAVNREMRYAEEARDGYKLLQKELARADLHAALEADNARLRDTASRALTLLDQAIGDTDPADPDDPLLLATQTLASASGDGA